MVRFIPDGSESEKAALAPVTPIFRTSEQAVPRSPSDAESRELSVAAITEDAAETLLIKRLRSRQLSRREAERLLTSQGVSDVIAERVIVRCEERGYVDDARLAEQLVHTAMERKKQGRRAVAQALSQRGIPSEVAESALAEVSADDDLERAREFAQQKARSMLSLDRETALRRLHGQLSRRGFSGGVAMSAAQHALDDAGITASAVRFR